MVDIENETRQGPAEHDWKRGSTWFDPKLTNHPKYDLGPCISRATTWRTHSYHFDRIPDLIWPKTFLEILDFPNIKNRSSFSANLVFGAYGTPVCANRPGAGLAGPQVGCRDSETGGSSWITHVWLFICTTRHR
jgi:hypothetical protein